MGGYEKCLASPRMELPEASLLQAYHDNYTLEVNPTICNGQMYGYIYADWASDTQHRKSITGIALLYAGGVVGYHTKYQDTITHSRTEAEFTAACDAGKLILYFRSQLYGLGIEQRDATILYEDNNGACMMANAQQRRTRHMGIKISALLEWVE